MNSSWTSYTVGLLAALFPIANPIGAIPIFYSLTAQDTPKYRIRQAQKTVFYVIAILATFLIAGRLILGFFGISLGVLRIAGGLIVAHSAWEMVVARQRLTSQEHHEAIDKDDISFTPMATPMIAGPGAIGVVIGFATQIRHWSEYLSCLAGIGLFGVVLYCCLALGEPLIGKLGKNGIGAMNRIFGFLILAIAVGLIVDGVLEVLKTNPSH